MQRIRRAGAIAAATCLLLPSLAWAQDGLSATQSANVGNDTLLAASANNSSDASSPDAGPVPAYTSGAGYFIRALGKANPLGEGGPLAWGPISVQSAEFMQYYGNTEFPAPIPSQSETVSVFSTTLAFEKILDRYKLALQYRPEMFVYNGAPSYDANQDVGLNTEFELSPRWGLTAGDTFNYYASQRVNTDLGLDLDYEAAVTAQNNNFLNGPGSTLFNDASGLFSYLWTPRTIVSFGPSYVYERSNGALVGGPGAEETATYTGGLFALTHLLNAASKFNVTYQVQYANFTNSTAIAGPLAGTDIIHNAEANYFRQFGGTWHFNAGVGVTDDTGAGSYGAGLAANVGLSKTLSRAEVAVGFEQGRFFSGFITNQLTDREDALLRVYWTARLTMSSTFSYFETTGGGPGLSGLYGVQEVDFRLTPRVSLVATGSYVNQYGDGVYILTGSRYLFSGGIRWDANPPAVHD